MDHGFNQSRLNANRSTGLTFTLMKVFSNTMIALRAFGIFQSVKEYIISSKLGPYVKKNYYKNFCLGVPFKLEAFGTCQYCTGFNYRFETLSSLKLLQSILVTLNTSSCIKIDTNCWYSVLAKHLIRIFSMYIFTLFVFASTFFHKNVCLLLSMLRMRYDCLYLCIGSRYCSVP
jgi:hypothetical protein